MTRIILDDAMRKKLHDVSCPLELCDESGRILGHVTPYADPKLHNLEPPISQEEIERISASEDKWYTTAEVLAHLESL